MSLMRINYVRNEIKKLSTVIENLIKNYDRDYKKFDSEYKSVKNVLEQKIIDVEKKSDWETHADLIEEETTYLKPIENIKNLAQFQNELILFSEILSKIVSVYTREDLIQKIKSFNSHLCKKVFLEKHKNNLLSLVYNFDILETQFIINNMNKFRDLIELNIKRN